MKPILYFLRSSEQKIANDILHFAYRLDDTDKRLKDLPKLNIYSDNYGLTNRDLGLYALSNHKIAGALWLRLLKKDDKANAYVDNKTAILTIGVKPEFRGEGIGTEMLKQLFLEAGTVFEQISISILNDEKTVNYFKKFGFEELKDSKGKSPVDEAEVLTMIKKLSNEKVLRPSDGYDPKKWMD